MKYYLAIDIGASSGRHIIGCRIGEEIRTDEVYRFYNGVTETDGHLTWDIDRLARDVIEGIKAAFSKYPKIESLSIDTWGVDYVLMNGESPILPVYAYRDSRTEDAIDRVHGIIPFDELYSKTGIQFQPFNTIYQLYQDKIEGRLDNASDFLMIPQYLTWVLTGVKTHEYTECTTGGMVNAVSREYDGEIISRLGLPSSLFGKISPPGIAVGELKGEIAEYVGGQTKVLLCASHDTGSAVEGIAMERDQLFLSSGTWSLLGTTLDTAILTEESRLQNYTNEGGVGYIRYLKNIMGMWIVNNLRAELCPELDFPSITEKARESDFCGRVDINDGRFLAPRSMAEAFDSCFAPEDRPKAVGDYFKSAFVSLAHCYKDAIEGIERITKRSYTKLYIVGGGAKNGYLNELTEQICGIRVIALPIEATALGNLKIQIKSSEVQDERAL